MVVAPSDDPVDLAALAPVAWQRLDSTKLNEQPCGASCVLRSQTAEGGPSQRSQAPPEVQGRGQARGTEPPCSGHSALGLTLRSQPAQRDAKGRFQKAAEQEPAVVTCSRQSALRLTLRPQAARRDVKTRLQKAAKQKPVVDACKTASRAGAPRRQAPKKELAMLRAEGARGTEQPCSRHSAVELTVGPQAARRDAKGRFNRAAEQEPAVEACETATRAGAPQRHSPKKELDMLLAEGA